MYHVCIYAGPLNRRQPLAEMEITISSISVHGYGHGRRDLPISIEYVGYERHVSKLTLTTVAWIPGDV